MAASLLDSFVSAYSQLRRDVRQAGVDFVLWSVPQMGHYKQRSAHGWPLAELDEMLLVLCVYVLIILWGQSVFAAKPAAAAAATGAAAAAGVPEEKLSKSAAKAAAKLAAAAAAAPRAASPWTPLKYCMAAYNLVQVALCSYIVVGTLAAVFGGSYYPQYRVAAGSLWPICTPCAWNVASPFFRFQWLFYMSKVLDFADTVFIILRGSREQFIFLHLYHHLSVFPVQWLTLNVGANGDNWWSVVANAFVHVVMYSYYGLSSVGMRPWWGRYVTQLQIVQFLSMIAHSGFLLYRGCPYPWVTAITYHLYVISLLVLFVLFYVRKYLGGGVKKEAAGEVAIAPHAKAL